MRVVMFRPGRLALLLALCGLAAFALLNQSEAQEDPGFVVVTSAADTLEEGEPECPHAELCTLRAAIEHANEQPGEERFAIRFDGAVFPPETLSTIAVEGSPLPTITRPNVTVDGAGVGVEIDGAALDGEGVQVGLRMTAPGAIVEGLSVRNFRGTCLLVDSDGASVGGERTAGKGNLTNSCGHGIAVGGEDVTVQGNVAGFAPTEGGVAMDTAIELYDGSGLAGGSGDEANYAGGALRGIVVRTRDAGTATATIRGNVLGAAPNGVRSPVGYGVLVLPPAGGTTVEDNRFAAAETGIAIAGANSDGAAPSTGNTIRGNTYEEITALAIDLGDDGRTFNDPDAGEGGPNDLQPYPEFSRAVQAAISGRVPGPCSGCTVELYIAEHRFDVPDAPRSPVPDSTAATNSQGTFTFESPPVAPGQWVMATVTDADGNTSEFSDAARVGTGLVQCGTGTLGHGWNASGYFGSTTSLGAAFPPNGPGARAVSAIHRLQGAGEYKSWYVDNGGNLSLLETGEPYWFYASEPVTLGGAFTLTEAFPADLHEGWNHFVYIGAEVGVAVGLESLDEQFTSLFRYDTDEPGSGWSAYGAPDTPDWVRGFTTLEPCQTYFINMTADATLEPPQP